MYVVTVKFVIKEKYLAQFMAAMHKQAEDTLKFEPHCTQFDVAVSESSANTVFLYEIYHCKADFNQHLQTVHFINFSKIVAPFVVDKQVECFIRQ